MVTKHSIEQQLKDIGFNVHGWGRTEVRELPNIILPDEEIYECVNGFYEGGFALLVATNVRVFLVDKKPMNYLTVEDLRFDMISEIDYSHRLLGARINISTGSKNLHFTSFNQPRLRKLIGHVQHCMAEMKLKQSEHQEDQKLHLEQINRRLQSYLLEQHRQQQAMQQQLQAAGETGQPAAASVQPVRPSPQLADYLFAQSLLAQHQAQTGQSLAASSEAGTTEAKQVTPPVVPQSPRAQPSFSVPSLRPQAADLYQEGLQEVFGRRSQPQPVTDSAVQSQPSSPPPAQADTSTTSPLIAPLQMTTNAIQHALEVSPLRIAYSKLPMAMRNRKFGRPSFHAHSQVDTEEAASAVQTSDIAPAHP